MAGKHKSKRHHKKEVMRRFEKNFDAGRLDYQRLAKTIKPRAMLTGLVVAGGIYMLGFGLTYWAMASNSLPLETFAKLVWMMMIPTTIFGFFAWQLSKNRLEYPIRMTIREYIQELESNTGLLWRFLPIMDFSSEMRGDIRKAFSWSQQGKVEDLAIEEYTDAVKELADTLFSADSKHFTAEFVAKFEKNFTAEAAVLLDTKSD